MSSPYGMQHLKNQYCSNCKRKKLEDRVKDILAVVKDILAVVQHIEARSWQKTPLGSTKRGALTFCYLMLHNANLRS